MKRAIFAALLVAATFQTVYGALAPPPGVFDGYFFIDRWGQGVFHDLFVDGKIQERFKTLDWRPIRVEATSIFQPINPGAAMIQTVSKVSPLSIPRLGLSLSLDRTNCTYGQHAFLKVSLHNNTKGGIELSKRDLLLIVTNHRRGALPHKEVERDEIFDCFNQTYLDLSSPIPRDYDYRRPAISRASYSVSLLVDEGRIIMTHGCPVLMRVSPEGEKRVTLYDEVWTTIQPGADITLSYEVGDGWLANEYEFQASYHDKDDTVNPLSRPCSFDIVVQNGG